VLSIVIMLSVEIKPTMLNVIRLNAECRICCVKIKPIMLSIIMQDIPMLNVAINQLCCHNVKCCYGECQGVWLYHKKIKTFIEI